MVMASEERKVFVEILKGIMPKMHNEIFQTWFLCQQFAGLCKEDMLCEIEDQMNCRKVKIKDKSCCFPKLKESQ